MHAAVCECHVKDMQQVRESKQQTPCLLLSTAGQFMPVRWRTSTGTGTTASIQVCDLTSYDDDSLAALDKLSGEAGATVCSCWQLAAGCGLL